MLPRSCRMKKIVIHTDGGCRGNPGPGGWAAVLEYGSRRKEVSGGVPATTNNRMELQAAIEAFRALKEPCEVEIHTDSSYLRDGISGWIHGWKRNGWMTKAKKPVKNADLWRELDAALRGHKIEWRWLKGHAGHAGNERCDQLANKEIDKIMKSHSAARLRECLEEFRASERDEASAGDLFFA